MKGVMDPDFEKAAFEQEVGTYSKEPVKTQYGYHVIQVVGHEVRPLTSTDRSNAIDRAYKNWLENAKSNLKIETGSDWVDFVPVEPTLSDL
jgi:parvulin-like peptidyl-prolyl isomerase